MTNSKMIAEVVEQYLNLYSDEATKLSELNDLVASGKLLNDRKTLPGHITGSAIVVSPDKSTLLMINHKFLQKWLQPGGHWDPEDDTPLVAAEREVVEETGVKIGSYLPMATNHFVPLDIDSHLIPANPAKGELEHTHHDFRYAFVASDLTLTHQEIEVDDADWVAFDDLRAAHLQPVLIKLRRLLVS